MWGKGQAYNGSCHHFLGFSSSQIPSSCLRAISKMYVFSQPLDHHDLVKRELPSPLETTASATSQLHLQGAAGSSLR